MYQENTINHAFELVPSHSLMLFTLLNEEINTFIRGSFRWYLIMIDNLAILNSLKLDDSSYFRIEYCVSVLIRLQIISASKNKLNREPKWKVSTENTWSAEQWWKTTLHWLCWTWKVLTGTVNIRVKNIFSGSLNGVRCKLLLVLGNKLGESVKVRKSPIGTRVSGFWKSL